MMTRAGAALRGIRGGGFGVLVALMAGMGLMVGCLNSPGTSQDTDLVTRQVSSLEGLVQEDPENADLRVRLAIYYSEEENYDGAIAQLREALRANESHQGALTALGDVYMEQGRYQDAIDTYSHVVELNRNSPMRLANRRLETTYYWLGVAYLELGEAEEAAEQFQEALSIVPTDADARFGLGVAYNRLGNSDDAIWSLKNAITFVPDYEEAYVALAEAFDQKGDPAMGDWARAMVGYSRGASKESIRDLRELLLRIPDSPDVYLGLGLAYEADGLPGMAGEAYRNVLRLDPENWLAEVRYANVTSGVAE